MKMKLGLLYGGKSAEHKVSLQTALAVTNALDFSKFDIHPIYITTEGEWITGKQLTGPAQNVQQLTLESEAAMSPAALNTELFPAAAEGAKGREIRYYLPCASRTERGRRNRAGDA